MLAVDILILVVIVAAALIGYHRGIIAQIGKIAGMVSGVILTRLLGPKAVELTGAETPFAVAASYAIVFVIAYAAAWGITRAVRGTVRSMHLGLADRLGGAALNVAVWGFSLSLGLNVALLIDHDAVPTDATDKPWREAAVNFAPAVLGYLSDMHHDQQNQQ